MSPLEGGDLQALAHARADLAGAGATPGRFAGLVRAVRRVLWPFIRPYHFRMLDRIAELERQIELAKPAPTISLEPRLDELWGHLLNHSSSIHVLAARIDEYRADATAARAEELKPVLREHARQRSDIVALTNRNGWMEQAVTAHSAKVEELAAGQAAQAVRISRLEEAAGTQQTAIDALIQDDHASSARITALEQGAGGHQTAIDALIQDDHASAARIAALESNLPVVAVMQARQAAIESSLFLASSQGGVFVLKTGDLISETVRRTNEWDRHVIEAAARAAASIRRREPAPASLVALDIGAHFGLISVPLAAIFDRVVSFEANTFNMALLQANTHLNALAERIELRREAVSGTDGIMSLAPDDQQEIPLPRNADGELAPVHAENLGAYSFVTNGTGLMQTQSVRLDSLDVRNVAFIKIDVQGGDGAVIMGGLSLIARTQPWIVFEWEDLLSQKFGISFAEVCEQLGAIHYVVEELHRHNDKQVDYLARPAADVAGAG